MTEMSFFVPGRTELGGNHTDHQGGCILGGAMTLGISALAHRNGTDTVHIESKGFGVCDVEIGDTGFRPDEAGTFPAFVRGVMDTFLESGNVFGGFDAVIESEIPVGSGLSSSAAFSVLIGKILSGLYFENTVPDVFLAKTAKRAENEFFGKPCGLMDPLICAVGQTVFADFADENAPYYEPIDFDFSASAYRMALIDSGSSHENLTADYAGIPRDMHLIAGELGHELLSEADAAEFYAVFPILRQKYGDRPAFRAHHFFSETIRAREEADALKTGDFEHFLSLFRESAESSETYLQNIVSENEPEHRLLKAIEAARHFLGGEGGVRVHGGGFAGMAQAFVPAEAADSFAAKMEEAGFPCFFPELI